MRRPFAARTLLRLFAGDTRGATVIEYGLICALIFVAVMGSIRLMATTYQTRFLTPVGSAIQGIN